MILNQVSFISIIMSQRSPSVNEVTSTYGAGQAGGECSSWVCEGRRSANNTQTPERVGRAEPTHSIYYQHASGGLLSTC